jgi:uncharacterized protein (DUF362 family)
MTVSVVKYIEGSNSLKKAIQLSDGFKNLDPTKSVTIKPNIVTGAGAKTPRHGLVTSAELMEELFILLREYGCTKISLAEGSLLIPELKANTQSALDWSGLGELAHKYEVAIVDMNQSDFRTFEFRGHKIRISNVPFDTDFFINFPVLKTHAQTKVSLGFKNLKGCLHPQSKKDFHRFDLEGMIATLGQTIKPDLVLIDGIYGLQKGPFGQDAHLMNVVVAGTDPLEVDVVGSCLMGIKPESVGYLSAIAEAEGRTLDPSKIEIRGETIEGMMLKLEWYYPWTTELMELYNITGLRLDDPGDSLCSGCSVTAYVAVRNFLKGHAGSRFDNLEICIGRNRANNDSKHIFLIGKCAIEANKGLKHAHKIKGCPVLINQTVDALNNELKDSHTD